jgi:hypothetical protein
MAEKNDSTIGQQIDDLWKLRQQIKVANAKVKVLEEKETAAEVALLGRISEADLNGAKGRHATATILRHTIASVKNWPKLTKWISKTKRFEILQKRISTTTLNELAEHHVKVPGIEAGVKKSIGLTTLK